MPPEGLFYCEEHDKPYLIAVHWQLLRIPDALRAVTPGLPRFAWLPPTCERCSAQVSVYGSFSASTFLQPFDETPPSFG